MYRAMRRFPAWFSVFDCVRLRRSRFGAPVLLSLVLIEFAPAIVCRASLAWILTLVLIAGPTSRPCTYVH
jgi:hypothetical protein